jgi:hypothetical protein
VNRASGTILLLATTLVAACGDAPIAWSEPASLPPSVGDFDRIELQRDGSVITVFDSAVTLPERATRCAGSLRAARDTGGDW